MYVPWREKPCITKNIPDWAQTHTCIKACTQNCIWNCVQTLDTGNATKTAELIMLYLSRFQTYVSEEYNQTLAYYLACECYMAGYKVASGILI